MSGRALLACVAVVFVVLLVWFMSIDDEVNDPNGPWGGTSEWEVRP
ncbi:hypothetical protein VA596_41620 [Amycolatopsis sp., V23-08]|uniref:Uncharacterized protein n=1 Tax=Amycolatopsis heterodermiae TaxID=3110235 RepID=A0ABU5RII2_9PSEU|nr:hypothetical protein [Amycolatopsis sp., V23-08]MEA5366086.1 hypothetical protein [Amycolatopsis sp., V23-08]